MKTQILAGAGFLIRTNRAWWQRHLWGWDAPGARLYRPNWKKAQTRHRARLYC